MKYFISYGNEKFKNSKKRILKEAISSKLFDECKVFSPEDLSESFRSEFDYILKKERGGGYWIWKFDIIKQTLDKMEEGDFLTYCDAGCSISNENEHRYFEYLNMLKNSQHGILSFVQYQWDEKNWTTDQLFHYFENIFGIDRENFYGGQLLGGVIIMKKCKITLDVINACIECVRDDMEFITDFYNQQNQKSFFIENRHDQSISSLMRKVYGTITISYYDLLDGPFKPLRIRE